MDILLHAGIGHPDQTLLVLTGILSFAAGLGTGAYAMLRRKMGKTSMEPVEN